MSDSGFRSPRAATIPALVSLAVGAWSVAAYAATPPAQTEFHAFKIGNDKAVSLHDGGIQEPNDGKSFVLDQPTAEVARVLTGGGAPGDRFEFSIEPLLVHAGKRVLLFDSGAGTNFGDLAGRLVQSMAAAGEKPGGVTDIFISHAHGDHVGGLVTSTGDLTFPSATIHMTAAEWQWLSGMSDEDAKNVGLQHVSALVKAIRPKVVPFQPGAELVPGVVKAVDIKGHTPGHSGYRIGSDSNNILFVGDTMHSYVVSVRKPSWQVAFDNDKTTGAASRTALVEQSAATGQRLYVEHFPFPGVGKIVKDKTGAYTWAPESSH
jgi:glyoxylase-like metal-dependent hydrolase (beta-lactamase superfamily II)